MTNTKRSDVESVRFRSIVNLHNALLKETKASQILRRQLIDACVSQGSLAALNDPALRIVPMSLNTLKTLSDKVLEKGGWQSLDILRKLASEKSASRINRAKSAQARVSETRSLKDKLEAAQRTRAILNRAYLESLELLEKASRIDDHIAELVRVHKATYLHSLSLHVVEKVEK